MQGCKCQSREKHQIPRILWVLVAIPVVQTRARHNFKGSLSSFCATLRVSETTESSEKQACDRLRDGTLVLFQANVNPKMLQKFKKITDRLTICFITKLTITFCDGAAESSQ